mmetsp:Transcript_47364/g.86797  ORF Transcript_47364/g.86797 Transcript_47364/m.86797 type:complete len:398 (-) Transcript_47364:12-1205(-)
MAMGHGYHTQSPATLGSVAALFRAWREADSERHRLEMQLLKEREASAEMQRALLDQLQATESQAGLTTKVCAIRSAIAKCGELHRQCTAQREQAVRTEAEARRLEAQLTTLLEVVNTPQTTAVTATAACALHAPTAAGAGAAVREDRCGYAFGTVSRDTARQLREASDVTRAAEAAPLSPISDLASPRSHNRQRGFRRSASSPLGTQSSLWTQSPHEGLSCSLAHSGETFPSFTLPGELSALTGAADSAVGSHAQPAFELKMSPRLSSSASSDDMAIPSKILLAPASAPQASASTPVPALPKELPGRVIGPSRWADDPGLARRLQLGGQGRSASPAGVHRGRGAPRGGRQPRRAQVGSDIHRLPDFVRNHFHEAQLRSPSMVRRTSLSECNDPNRWI